MGTQNEYMKLWYKKNRKAILNQRKVYLRNRFRRALNEYGHGKKYSMEKYGIDIDKCYNKLKPIRNGKFWHLDHIRPLCSFDLSKKMEIQRAFSPSNVQWLSAQDNLRKGGRFE